MNEQIKLLIEQATTIVEHGWGASSENFDRQKFAKLIVNECCKRLSEETIGHDGYGYNQHELYNRLRKHFGVEE